MLTLATLENDLIPLVAIGGGLLVGMTAIIFGNVSCIMRRRAREATKREIAAYVAEGSISPDDAEKIIKADTPRWENS